MGKRKRTPLAAGNRYAYEGFASNGFVVKWFTFAENDGIPGVAVKWFGLSRTSGFYPFKSERAFWRNWIFRNAVDAVRAKSERSSPISGRP